MISRREAAQRLDISVQMATKHGLPPQLTESDVAELEQNPPAWLAQSRANRSGKKAVWVDLVCSVCGATEKARPKKWWPEFTHVVCDHHPDALTPEVASGARRDEFPGVGRHLIGLVDSIQE